MNEISIGTTTTATKLNNQCYNKNIKKEEDGNWRRQKHNMEYTHAAKTGRNPVNNRQLNRKPDYEMYFVWGWDSMIKWNEGSKLMTEFDFVTDCIYLSNLA